MSLVSKFTDEQKLEVALDLLSGKLSHAEVCRKYDISSTYAYKLKDRAQEILREGIGRPAGHPDREKEELAKRVADLEQLAGDQALVIRHPKEDRCEAARARGPGEQAHECSPSGPCDRGTGLECRALGLCARRSRTGTSALSGLGRPASARAGAESVRGATPSHLRSSPYLGAP